MSHDGHPPQFSPRRPAPRPASTGARRVDVPPEVGPPEVSTDATPGVRASDALRRVEARVPAPRAPRPTRPPAAAAVPPPIPNTDPRPARPRTPARPRRRRAPRLVALTATMLALLLAWPVGLLVWANGEIQHTQALSSANDTSGQTYLLVGSDSRADGTISDGTEGQRADTVLLLHRASNGSAAMISLPRDTFVQIEGYGENKLNASYAFGGAPLLVDTVETLTSLTVDHYVEVGMGGVVALVDAVGGVNLCLDYDVDDELSQLKWTAGCHDVDGATALAFARMRYSDPLGDIGRQARQRQVISAVVSKVATPSTLLNPFEQVSLIDVGTSVLVTDEDTGIVDIAMLALAFRSATGEDGVSGGPPIADFDYHPGRVGSTVLLDETLAPAFFEKLRDGELTPEDIQQFG